MEPTRRSSHFRCQRFPLFGLVVALAAATLVFTAGCSKSSEETAPATKPGAPAQSTPATGPAAAGGAGADTTAKLAGMEWAVKQDEIKNDPTGQWASEATASSTYNDAQGDAPYSPQQATGAPNVEQYADDGRAWTPREADAGIEWLELKFPKAVHATEVRVRESCASGAIMKVELFDELGGAHSVWSGTDPTTQLNYLLVKFPKTDFKTARVKVTLATNVVAGWNEIDAVQLVGTEQ